MENGTRGNKNPGNYVRGAFIPFEQFFKQTPMDFFASRAVGKINLYSRILIMEMHWVGVIRFGKNKKRCNADSVETNELIIQVGGI